ncbi:MAG: TolC family protein [Paucimonas sp.]|nr:TolC family protein [Paucimonas sp.]
MRATSGPLAAAASLLLLAGCASFSQDEGLDRVSEMTRERIGQPVSTAPAQTRVVEILIQPLTPDTAVELALLNNRSLQASLSELRIAKADLVQAGRMRNPGFSFGRVRTGTDLEIDRSIIFELGSLITMPLRQGIEQRRFERTQLAAAGNVVGLAADVRRAYFNAIAARQSAQYLSQVVDAAEAGAELGKRLASVGNWSKLDAARERAFYAEATAQFARARQSEVAAREQLTRLLGLWGDAANFKLPERLPDIPKAPNEIRNAEAQAMERRLDVQVAKRETEATARALGLTNAVRFVNVLDIGYVNKSEADKPRGNGYEVGFELPIFDWGTARKARAEAIYMQSLHAAADAAIRARSQVRESYSAYRATYDIARHYRDEVVPLRKRISEELLLRFNGMLVGTFELLTDAREQVGAVSAAIDAQRDFWVAETNLQSAISGTGSVPTAMATRQAAAAAAPAGH